MKYLLWWSPRIATEVGRGASVLGTLTGLRESMDMYERGLTAGLTPGLSASLVGLRRVMSYVPIVNTLYGSIVEGIPGLAGWYRDLIQNRIDPIEAASRAA